MAKIKGLAFVACKKFLEKRYSDEEIGVLEEKVGPEIYEIFMNPDLKKYYSMRDFIKLNMLIIKTFYEDDFSNLKKIGRFSCDVALKGVYSVFFKFGSPQFIIKRCAAFFSEYYDKGELKVIAEDNRSIQVELSGFEKLLNFEVVCRRIEGFIERGLEVCSGKTAKVVQSKCITEGDDTCVFECTW